MDTEAGGLGKLRSGHEGTPLRAGVGCQGTVNSFCDTAVPALESLTALGPALPIERASWRHGPTGRRRAEACRSRSRPGWQANSRARP